MKIGKGINWILNRKVKNEEAVCYNFIVNTWRLL